MLTRILLRGYDGLLRLYPRRFRAEFAGEMQTVLADAVAEAAARGGLALMALCWRELRDWPRMLLREHGLALKKGREASMSDSLGFSGKAIGQAGAHPGSSRAEALLGLLPFAAFGLASMLGRSNLELHSGFIFLGFYLLAVIGFGIGWVMSFPRWSYSYLGWALIFAWWWTDMATPGLQLFGYTFGRRDLWGWRTWAPLATVSIIALLWTRSLRPLRQLVAGLWQDWTLLSLGMYTFAAWFSLLYDENHHPYLFAFMVASTLAVAGGVWFYLRGPTTSQRALALLIGGALSLLIGWICEQTWDWRAYYGLPEGHGTSWYYTPWGWAILITFWALFLLWPALLGLAQHAVNRQRPT